MEKMKEYISPKIKILEINPVNCLLSASRTGEFGFGDNNGGYSDGGNI